MTTWNEFPLSDKHRSGNGKNRQLSLDLEAPTGFIEAHYAADQGALFIASATQMGESITHLIRDIPDSWTHLGWSAKAEYRSGGHWVKFDDAPVTDDHHFTEAKTKKFSNGKRWKLAGGDSTTGLPVAAELCATALNWWDSHGEGPIWESSAPSALDFCSVFPRLHARRDPDDENWRIIYSTDSADWTLAPNGEWAFASERTLQESIAAVNLDEYLVTPWKHYAKTIENSQAPLTDVQTIRELEAVATLFRHGTKFPLILALLPTLLKNNPNQSWTFRELAKYSALNAKTGYEGHEGSEGCGLYVQNDIVRWRYRQSQWNVAPRLPILQEDEPLNISQIIEATRIADLDLNPPCPLHSSNPHDSTIWAVTTGDERVPADFPIHDVVRGAPNEYAAGWRLLPGLERQWTWGHVEEFNWERRLPWDEGESFASVDTDLHEIDQIFGVWLETYWSLYMDGEFSFDVDPTWFTFLEWVANFS